MYMYSGFVFVVKEHSTPALLLEGREIHTNRTNEIEENSGSPGSFQSSSNLVGFSLIDGWHQKGIASIMTIESPKEDLA